MKLEYRVLHLPQNNSSFHTGTFFWDTVIFPCHAFHLHESESPHCYMYEKYPYGEIFQYWQASKDSHVCRIVCAMSEFPLQTGSNKLITLRSKWLTSCSPSLKYLHVKRWEKPKRKTLSYYLLTSDMEKNEVKYTKWMQENMTGLYYHCWESFKLARGTTERVF